MLIGIFTHRNELKMAARRLQIPAMFFHKRPPLLEHHAVGNVCCVGAYKQPRCQVSAAKPFLIKANRNACDTHQSCLPIQVLHIADLRWRVHRRACGENINDGHIRAFVPMLQTPHVDCWQPRGPWRHVTSPSVTTTQITRWHTALSTFTSIMWRWWGLNAW